VAKKQKFPYLLGSKWTAQQTLLGWRHFQVINRQRAGRCVFAELVSACDRQARLWIDAQQLKNRQLWQPGWQTLADMTANGADAPEPSNFDADNFYV